MKKLFIFILFISIIFLPSLAMADDVEGKGGNATVSLQNPIGGNPTPQTLVGRIINAILGLVGSLALLMFIYGGFTWMMASGNEQRVQKGKDILMWATVGLIVIFSSYAILSFVFEGLGITE